MGLVLGVVVLNIHEELAASQGAYASFCDISDGMSCDVVLGSSYASFLGIPVGAWALLAYIATAVLALLLGRAPAEKKLPLATLLLGLTGAMLAVAGYFFVVSTVIIGVICPMCLSMDAVNIALFVAAFAQFRLLPAAASPDFSASRILLVAAAGTVAGLALLVIGQSEDGPTGPMTVEEIRRKDPKFYAFYISQPVVGAPGTTSEIETSTPVTIVEYSDYECPYCRRAFLFLDALKAEDPDGVTVVHRNFPLSSACNPAITSSGHGHACDAALASICAYEQGKGRDYSYLLFTADAGLSPEALAGFAQHLGLDQAAFAACQDSPETAEILAQQVQEGIDAGIESTPTMFINGRLIKGVWTRADQYRSALTIERSLLPGASAAGG